MLEFDEKSVAFAVPVAFQDVKGRGNYVVPKGGIFSVINQFRKIIIDNGGKVYNNSLVSKIVIESGMVSGIISGGKFHKADIIISGIDINKTYNELIGQDFISNKKMLSDLANKWEITKPCFGVWLGFDYTLDELDIEYGSYVYYPNEKNISEVRSIMKQENELLPDDFWFQVFTAFSGDEKSAPKGKSQITLGMLLPYHYENDWGGEKDYQAVKKNIENMMVNAFEKIYPKAKGKYSFIESASPISYEKYSGNLMGSHMGYERYQNFIFDKNRHQNQGLIDNLFFASQWVSTTGGVCGVLQEGMKAANLIMKRYPIAGEPMEEYIINR